MDSEGRKKCLRAICRKQKSKDGPGDYADSEDKKKVFSGYVWISITEKCARGLRGQRRQKSPACSPSGYMQIAITEMCAHGLGGQKRQKNMLSGYMRIVITEKSAFGACAESKDPYQTHSRSLIWVFIYPLTELLNVVEYINLSHYS